MSTHKLGISAWLLTTSCILFSKDTRLKLDPFFTQFSCIFRAILTQYWMFWRWSKSISKSTLHSILSFVNFSGFKVRLDRPNDAKQSHWFFIVFSQNKKQSFMHFLYVGSPVILQWGCLDFRYLNCGNVKSHRQLNMFHPHTKNYIEAYIPKDLPLRMIFY